jgi:DNA-binding SARP family transcriptional activator/streptogramin lyase
MASGLKLKVFLAGRVAVETDGMVIDEVRFAGRQGRLLFAYLVAEQGRPVPRDELAEALWGEALPATWDKALTVIVSKLRGLLADRGIDDPDALTGAFGCYRLELPEGTWVDVVVAVNAAHEAEDALALGDLERGKAAAALAASLVQQPFLPGEEGAWVEEKRRELADVRGRALSALADAWLRSGDAPEAVKWAEQMVALEPFRETGYRRLMEAHVAAGNRAEALQVYERCRRLLAEELGAYPSPETEAAFLEIVRSSPRGSTAEVDQLDAEGISEFPPPAISRHAKRHRRRLAALVAAVLLVVGAAAIAFVLTKGGEAQPEVLPNSVVRIDPQTLKPTQVVRVGDDPDLVVVAGGFVWVTNHGRRYAETSALRNAGDRTLTRVDPSTGHAVPVGGGLAPCGLAADPSGDVWVANCYPAGSGPSDNVVRVDAKTREFGPTWPVRAGTGYFRGLAYGGGSLWLADVSGAVDYHGVTQVDPRTGHERTIEFHRHAGWLAWSGGYGDLWMNDFDRGTVSRMHPATGALTTFRSVGINPAALVVQGDAVWVGDWASPQLVRLPAVGSGRPRHDQLPVKVRPAGVTTVAAGAGFVWATVPDSHALWRIDPRTNHVTRIAMPYFPWGVAVGDDGVWVTVRGKLDG